MLSQQQIDMIPGADVYSTDGDKIGRAGNVYLDDETGRPEWATVHTGLFGMRESFLPISQAEIRDDRVTVPFGKDQVKDAPSVDPDGGHLSMQEEQRLYDHYGVQPSGTADANRARLRRHTMTRTDVNGSDLFTEPDISRDGVEDRRNH